MNNGFVISIIDQGVTARIAGAGIASKYPLVSSAEDFPYSCFLMGRLYYRNHLCRNLKGGLVMATRKPPLSDATLALAAFRELGCDGLQRLEGDFALAIWDPIRCRIVVVRDPMGGYPIFWAIQRSLVVCSTSLNAVVRLLPRQELQPNFFAEYLMPTGSRQEGPSELCAYDGVQRVLPGETIEIHVGTGKVERNRWWHWHERCVAPETDRLDDAAEEYGDVLRTSVKERLCGRTLSHLSGGMDSTGIALIARELIRTGNGSSPLHTISLVYHQLAKLSLENPYLEHVLANLGDVAVHRLSADDLLNFDGFIDPPPHDEPFAGLWHIETGRAILQIAAEVGTDTILTGFGADEVHDSGPYFLADLLRRGKWISAWRRASQIAEIRGLSAWRILYPYGCEPHLRLLQAGFRMYDWKPKRVAEPNFWDVAPWINPDFARQYDLAGRAYRNRRATFGLVSSVDLSVSIRYVQDRAGDATRLTLAAPHGMHIAHPFLDPRVVSLGLGIRSSIPIPYQIQKPVLSLALQNLLPREIRERRTKGHFDEIYYLGLVRHQHALRELIFKSDIDEFGMLDSRRLAQCLEKALLGGLRADHLQQFDSTLSLLRWLSLRRSWLLQADTLEYESLPALKLGGCNTK